VTKQVVLAVHFPGVNNTTVWSRPDSGSQMAFSSFAHMARKAEEGMFDFFFLAEGLRLREHRGRIHDLDVVGRPDSFMVLTALAAVTDRIGLAGTLNSTFREPYEVARQLATLDHLSGGRAAWNVVTSCDAFTGANFRRGGYLDYALRYDRAREMLETARLLWDSWAAGDPLADKESGRFVGRGDAGAFTRHGELVDIAGRFNVPRCPQGHPVIIQAGDSDPGRELAAATADVIFSQHSTYDAGRTFYADVKGRLARYARAPESLKILPASTVVVADSDDEAREMAREIRRRQVSPPTAINFLEQVWNRDLSAYDPDGPLPDIDPDVETSALAQGRATRFDDRLGVAKRWRGIAEAKKLSIRELVIEVTARGGFVGTPQHVAAEIDRHVQDDACDGFIFIPHLTPHGLDDFVDRVVPLFQERGVLRRRYRHETLRANLGLPDPVLPDAWLH
jgi:FMN-dependent oxidoreductase (nitrilotriacetate monooxygenase family)